MEKLKLLAKKKRGVLKLSDVSFMKFSFVELRDLGISIVVLAFAFASWNILLLPLTIIVIAFAFVLHELGHKFAAQRFGCFAEYKMWPYGLMLALVSSFFGIIFAAPGAVYISCLRLTKKQNGIISLSGPAANIALGFLFLLVLTFYQTDFLGAIILLTARISFFLALFNLLPFGPLDGSKVFAWDKKIWTFAITVSFLGWIFVM